MKIEFYDLVWNGTQLERNLNENVNFKLDDENFPPDPWDIHSSLGDSENIWCTVYRIFEQPGGLFIMHGYDDLLFVAQAKTNMAFAQGLREFSQMVSDPRYAADIFEDIESDDLDD